MTFLWRYHSSKLVPTMSPPILPAEANKKNPHLLKDLAGWWRSPSASHFALRQLVFQRLRSVVATLPKHRSVERPSRN